MPRHSTEIQAPGAGADRPPIDVVVLAHDPRHLRRKLRHTQDNDVVMLDLRAPAQLTHDDLLLTETGETIEVIAAEELLYEGISRGRPHLAALAWHLSNHDLPAQIEEALLRLIASPPPASSAGAFSYSGRLEQVTADGCMLHAGRFRRGDCRAGYREPSVRGFAVTADPLMTAMAFA